MQTLVFTNHLQNAAKFATVSIEETNLRNADVINEYRNCKILELADYISLEAKTLPSRQAKSKKLAANFIQTFKINEKLDNAKAYRLKPPFQPKGPHSTFHISQLGFEGMSLIKERIQNGFTVKIQNYMRILKKLCRSHLIFDTSE